MSSLTDITLKAQWAIVDCLVRVMRESIKKVRLHGLIDANTVTISRDLYFPNAYTIDFPLDSTPDHVWLDNFERQWRTSRHLWDRKLFVVGDKLRLVTTPMDLEDKLDWVKQVVERTNEAIDEYVEEVEARTTQMDEQAREKATDEERASVETIRETLRKSLGNM